MLFITLLCTLRGSMILSPRLQTASTMLCTAEVVPPTIKYACAAPNASAARSSASLMTETGWQRLSSIFIEFTSTRRHCSPRKWVRSGFPFPCLCPGTSNGTSRFCFISSNASNMGARDWSSIVRSSSLRSCLIDIHSAENLNHLLPQAVADLQPCLGCNFINIRVKQVIL